MLSVLQIISLVCIVINLHMFSSNPSKEFKCHGDMTNFCGGECYELPGIII